MVLGFAATWALVYSAAAYGADEVAGTPQEAGTLRAPACGEWMQLAVEPRAKQADGGAVRLVESGDGGQSLVGQWMPAPGPDGTASARALMLSVPPASDVKGTRKFRIDRTAAVSAPGLEWRPVGKASLELREQDRPVLTYNFDTIVHTKTPAKDARRARSGYVHPIYGLNGEVLTDDFPADHIHHHGLFWSWPHVGFDGRQCDLWVNEKVEQRFVKFLGREAGPAGAVIGVEAGWFIQGKKAVVERAWLRIWPAVDGQRAIDVRLVLIPIGHPLTLQGAEGKSYGGINLRYAPRKNTVITVPKGRTTEDLPDTPLEWADLSAKFGGASAPSGAAIFVPKTHADFPPTWLTRHYGILCVGWPGVRARTFPADRPIVMDYRVWIHKDEVTVDQLARAYAGYNLAAQAAWE